MKYNEEILARLVLDNKINKNDMLGIVSELNNANTDLLDYLLKNKICTENEYNKVVSEIFNIPFVDLAMLEIDKTLQDRFNLQLMKKHCAVPIMIDNSGTLIVAIADISTIFQKSLFRIFDTDKVDFVLAGKKDINAYIDSNLAVKQTNNALSDLKKDKMNSILLGKNEEEVGSYDEVVNAPAVRLVDSIIKEAIPFRASDIHIEPYENEVKVRYRIDGDLSERVTVPINAYPAVCARLKIISGMDIAERRIPQDGRINLNINNVEYDFRVSTMPTVYGEKFVIRVLDKTSFSFTRKDLGFTESENEIVDNILSHPHGLILLTGPTGCGKSTTLYSFLGELNKPNVNIVTVEDPVEYTMGGINQIQVNNKANLTFATALRSILRQDPDIVMVGEIRDEETAQIAIRAGITGHLVLSTLHTNNAPGAVSRLIDMGIEPYFVSDALVAVISQRLLKHLCPACKKKVMTTSSQMDVLGIDSPMAIYTPVGCPYCNHTGYKGRIAVHEIMYLSDAIKDGLKKGKTDAEDLKRIAINGGMKTLADSALNYLKNGIISFDEYIKILIGE